MVFRITGLCAASDPVIREQSRSYLGLALSKPPFECFLNNHNLVSCSLVSKVGKHVLCASKLKPYI